MTILKAKEIDLGRILIPSFRIIAIDIFPSWKAQKIPLQCVFSNDVVAGKASGAPTKIEPLRSHLLKFNKRVDEFIRKYPKELEKLKQNVGWLTFVSYCICIYKSSVCAWQGDFPTNLRDWNMDWHVSEDCSYPMKNVVNRWAHSYSPVKLDDLGVKVHVSAAPLHVTMGTEPETLWMYCISPFQHSNSSMLKCMQRTQLQLHPSTQPAPTQPNQPPLNPNQLCQDSTIVSAPQSNHQVETPNFKPAACSNNKFS